MSDDATRNWLEFECKLAGSDAALDAAVKAAGTLGEGPLTWRQDRLENTYFDTADRRLAKRGVSLRLRKKRGRWLQTLKTEGRGAGDLFARGEWECELEGPEIDLGLLPPDALEHMGLVLPGELVKSFRTVFTRRSAVLTLPATFGAGTEIELCVDRGHILSGRRKEEISEVELELQSGDRRALLDAAIKLQRAADLKVNFRSKAERGWRLVADTVDLPVKGAKVALTPGQTVSQAISTFLAAGLRHMLANEQAAFIGEDPEGVHQMRVAVRRMRSMFSVFSSLLDPARTEWVLADLKWLGEQLGPARDWDVFVEEILGPAADSGVAADGMAALQLKASGERTKGYNQVRRTLSSRRYAQLVLKLCAFTETEAWLPQPCPDSHPLRSPVTDVAPAILQKALKKVRKLGRNLAELDVETRHELRIKVKKLRYTTEFLQSLYPDSTEKKMFQAALSSLQDDFGKLNDVAVAERLLGDLTALPDRSAARRQAAGAAAGVVQGWHVRGLVESEPALLADWKRFAKSRVFWERDGKTSDTRTKREIS